MKSEFDRELDGLLRAHARRATSARATAPAAQVDAPGGAHLDADELSAYAENALPAPARARYTAHLADCDSCRGQVVLLTRAAGVAEQLAARPVVERERATAPSWRARLAALFAPAAWRYALPACALLLVGGLVYWVVIASRTSRSSTDAQIASAPRTLPASVPVPATDQNHAAATQTSAGDAGVVNSKPAAAAEPVGNANFADRPAPPQAAPAPSGGELIARNEPQPPAAGGVITAAPPPPLQTTSTYQAETQNERTLPNIVGNTSAGGGLSNQTNQVLSQTPPREYAPEPSPQTGAATANQQSNKESADAPAQPKAVAEAKKKGEDERSDDARGPRKSEARATDRVQARERDADEANLHGPSRAMNVPKDDRAGARRGRAEESERRSQRPPAGAAADSVSSEDAGETRSVAGRQFRRQRGAWVDTTYRQGQATVQVRRTSEQWRALVADEPELGRIANALGGEVIVVWRGRAYRIR
ncbi:MAG TPA: zf-HC2 domain-containing protein [Pyrinomonadaceae bacterium]|jgi:hypothetical protein